MGRKRNYKIQEAATIDVSVPKPKQELQPVVQLQTGSNQEKKEFLRYTLDILEKRRDLLTNRSAILLAANAALLAGMAQLNITVKWSLFSVFRFSLFSVSLLLNLLSLVKILQVTHVIHRKSHERQKNDLIAYTQIAKQTVLEYQDRVRGLSWDQIEHQYLSQIVSLSRLLEKRYNTLAGAYRLSFVSLIVFLLLVILVKLRP